MMYRVALSTALAATLAACSLNTGTLSTGFADNGPSTSALPSSTKRRAPEGALGGDPLAARDTAGAKPATTQKVARLDDKAPSGTFEKAPRGALADRDYSSTALDAEKARDLINQYRKDHGLKPLKLSTELSNAAKAHSRDLAKWDRISHYGSDGSNPWDRVKRTGYNPRIAAENVGTGQMTIEEVMKGWKDSPGHNKNLLMPDAEQMGIALVQDPKTEFKTFWTLVLGSAM